MQRIPTTQHAGKPLAQFAGDTAYTTCVSQVDGQGNIIGEAML